MTDDDPIDFERITLDIAKTAIHVVIDECESTSYFGNAPPKSQGFCWPYNKERPLVHLACIDLGGLPTRIEFSPATGRLMFFCDLYRPQWGYDPKHKDGWAVVYVREEQIEDGEEEIPASIEFEGIEERQPVSFRSLWLPPAWASREIKAYGFDDDRLQRYVQYRQSLFVGRPQHQIGGYPAPIQSTDMELECQLVSNGLYCGDSSGYRDPRAKALTQGASDWHLLFQIDSDDDLDLMWGDCGRVYFWIRRQDAEQCRFDATWTILQCY